MIRRLVAAMLATTALAGCATPETEASQRTGPAAVTTTTTTVTPSTPSAPPPPPPPPCRAPVRACVRLSTDEAWLMLAGRPVLGPVRISHGSAADPTPTGTFPVSWKDKEHTSSIYGTSMPHSVFFAPGGIAFHEGDVNAPSHGCVHLTRSDAERFFALAPGEIVQILP